MSLTDLVAFSFKSQAVLAALMAASLFGGASVAGPIEDALKSVVLIETPNGLGTGFVVHDRSVIATNFHVIEGASNAKATFSTGDKISVDGFLLASPEHDLAILHLAKPAPSLPLDIATEQVDLGTDVFAIGSPKGLAGSVSKGVVSAYRRWEELRAFFQGGSDAFGYDLNSEWIQTDAAITAGNSGGPLVLSNGTVIAVNTLASAHTTIQNINFAVKVSHLQKMLRCLPEEPRALASLPPSRNHTTTKQQPQETSAYATRRFWVGMAEVLGTFAAEYQQMLIDKGEVKLDQSVAIHAKDAQKKSVGLADPKFGKTKEERDRRIRRLAQDAMIPYPEALKLTFDELRSQVVAKRIQREVNAARAVYERNLAPGLVQLEKQRQDEATARRLAADIQVNCEKRYEMAWTAASKLDALPTQGVNPVVVEFATEMATMFRQEAHQLSKAQASIRVMMEGGSPENARVALEELNSVSVARVEMGEVTGMELSKRLSNFYGVEFGPILRFTREQAKLFQAQSN